MKKLVLLILIISLITITSISVLAADVTVAEGDPVFAEDNYDVIDRNFTNYGTVEIAYIFSVQSGTVVNNGSFTVGMDFNIAAAEGGQSEFINNDTLRIGSSGIGSSFRISSGTYFTNNGTLYLSNITAYDLSGTISGDGYFVCDSTVDANLVEELKLVSPNKVLTSDEYQSLMGENNSSLGGNSHEVTATYTPGDSESTVYKVDITWGSLEFTYTDSSKGTWNTDTHKYVDAKEGKWSWVDGANEITVTNHSNAEVTATASYTPEAGYEAIGLTFDKNTIRLATADNGVDGAAGTSTSDTIIVTPRGALKKSETRVVIGTITITIS